MDKIIIENLELFANHGVFPEETKLGQKFLINMELYLPTRKAGYSDDLIESVNYGEVSHFVTEFLTTHTYKLIEAAAEQTARAVLLHFPLIQKLKFSIHKPWAPVGLPLSDVAVEIERGWHKVYLAFGSNMGDRRKYIEDAVEELRNLEDCKVGRISDILETEPYGGVAEGAFFNGCLELRTLYTPEELLEKLHAIEAHGNRERKMRWGSRTIDLDILFYDDEVISTPELTIPHIDMANRLFVLEPLCEIAPYLWHPVLKKTVLQMKQELKGRKDIVLFDLDGTITNSKEGITKCAQYALKAYGIDEPDADKLEFFIGPPLKNTFMEHYGMDEETAVAAVAKYRERYHPTGIFECSLFDGVEDALKSLKRKGYRIGLASSKPEESCRRILEHFHILSYFDEVVGATMDGRIDSKYEVLQETIKRMHIYDTTEAVLIGDTRFDVSGAKEAHMDCIGITYGFGTKEELQEAGANAICDSIEEAAEYIERL